ncbi:hypothetical protein NC651_019683 [Populus alba x Populus x berolinensis]|nr:hypothetical protein NC651_019683 [Populus alba x Populus x berolinensis]
MASSYLTSTCNLVENHKLLSHEMLLHKLSQEVRRIHEKTLRAGEPPSQELVLLPLSKKCFVFDKIDVATTGIFKR